MTPRLGLVTGDPEAIGDVGDEELPQLLAALEAAGISADAPIWNDPNDWAGYDLLILRSPWDYSERPEDFLDWLGEVETQATIRNHPALVRWNFDKRYMDELAAHGVPCVRSAFCTNLAELRAALASHGGHQVVVKPSVSAGRRDTGLYRADDRHAQALGELILGDGKAVVVQPALPSVHDIGEPSLTYLGGRFSHAIRRRGILAVGGGFIEGAFSMPADPAQAADDEIALAERTLAAIREIMIERGLSERDAAPLYARFDLIRADDGTPLLLEAELFEPHYFTAQGEGSLDRFVEAVDAELSLGRAV